MKALERVGLVKMLAEPNLTAVSGETAKFLAGGEFPVPAGRDQQGNVSIQFKQFGVGLSFTPVVLSPGRISLQLSSEVSELTNTGSFTLGGSQPDGPGHSGPVGAPYRNHGGTAVRRQLRGRRPDDSTTPSRCWKAFRARKIFRSWARCSAAATTRTTRSELVVLVSAYLVEPNAESALSAPTDGFVAPTDPETLLLGRLNATYQKKDKPLTPQASAPVGFVVR